MSEDNGILDLSWLLYEQIALAIPIKHVHAPGKCNVVMTEKLSELLPYGNSDDEEWSAARSSDEDNDDGDNNIDPRWSALLKLKN